MNKEHRDDIIKIILSLVLFLLALLIPESNIWKIILLLTAYIIVGYSILYSAVKNIFHGEIFDENFLMSLATIGALILGEYSEAVAIMVLYEIGELFQDFAVEHSRKNIKELMNIKPEEATVIRNNQEIIVSPEEVKVGERVIVKPGEKVPLDGIIIAGSTSLNTVALTGESMPKDVVKGDRAVSGAVNLTGVITVEVESVYGESTVSKILDLVENSSNKKAKAEKFITKFAHYYTPCVVIGAVALAVLPPLFFSGDWTVWTYRALIFLVVSCPCALVISIPLSFFGGIGGAARNGILIKGADYLETLSKIKIVAFDKTGTLTKGNFAVTAIHPEKVSESELLDIAAAAESNSNHPIAESIIIAHGGHINKGRISDTREHPGLGIEAIIDGNKIFIGNSKLMDKVGAGWHECHKAGTVIHIAMEDEYLGHIIISDEIKPDARQALVELRKLGIEKISILTGDIGRVGRKVGEELGADEVLSELLPADKVYAVEDIMTSGKKLCFVGDGINDAPVLSGADIGVAMGGIGSDAAIEAADVVIMDDSLLKLPEAVYKAKKTMKIVKENIIFALGIKLFILVLGAFGFVNIEAAIFADVGVMILAVLNAIRTL